jgi:hypothetical protein
MDGSLNMRCNSVGPARHVLYSISTGTREDVPAQGSWDPVAKPRHGAFSTGRPHSRIHEGAQRAYTGELMSGRSLSDNR